MPDYKTMYLNLFNSVTDAVGILCEAKKKAEEIFINSSENEEELMKNIKIIRTKKE